MISGIRFLKAYRPFGAGDVAIHIPAVIAAKLVQEGIAEWCDFADNPYSTTTPPMRRVMNPQAPKPAEVKPQQIYQTKYERQRNGR